MSSTMKTAALLLVLVSACSCLPAQPARHPALEEALRKNGLRLRPVDERAGASQEIRVRLTTAQGAAPRVTAQHLQTVRRADPPPRQRSAEMTSDHLLVVVLDSRQEVRYWQIVIDPRLVRGEFPDANGNLHGTQFLRPYVELNVSIPDSIDAAEVRILAPTWPDGGLVLTPLAALKLTGGGRQ